MSDQLVDGRIRGFDEVVAMIEVLTEERDALKELVESCSRRNESDCDNIATLTAQRDIFEKELRETWDYQDENIAELLDYWTTGLLEISE